MKGEATRACAEPVLMMRPQPRFFIAGTAARMAWKAADRLIAMIASHFVDREFLDRRDVLDAGIVDEDVDRAELFSASATMAAISSGLVMSAAE